MSGGGPPAAGGGAGDAAQRDRSCEGSFHVIEASHQEFGRDTRDSGGRLNLLVEWNDIGEKHGDGGPAFLNPCFTPPTLSAA
ncbi:hypothetical protein DAETH_17170 [Deinococcus aetherius]|uniref:Uncharacterized protein n=1 Tax=Deinococcus aetherius TaxID=200252 RepID=A0ABN6RGC1_9DEIO|nr:hypothetical protein DAETH_17170 [Deinococcus aetherius]